MQVAEFNGIFSIPALLTDEYGFCQKGVICVEVKEGNLYCARSGRWIDFRKGEIIKGWGEIDGDSYALLTKEDSAPFNCLGQVNRDALRKFCADNDVNL